MHSMIHYYFIQLQAFFKYMLNNQISTSNNKQLVISFLNYINTYSLVKNLIKDMAQLITQILILSFFIILSQMLTIHTKNNIQTPSSPQLTSQYAHQFYNIEQTDRVSNSQSIKILNQCKDLCLEMHQIFPFQFKYHRLIYRQPDGMLKYITGECLYTFKSDGQQKQKNQQKTASQKQNNQKVTPKEKKWFPWSNLKNFIDLSTVEDQLSTEQKKAWFSYSKDCEDEQLKLSESSRIDFKFTMVHSDFQYLQNQGFSNLSPFDDLDQLINGLSAPV